MPRLEGLRIDARPADAALGYMARGYAPVPVPPRSKGPRTNGWQTLRLGPDDVPGAFADADNIGLLLGEPSGGLVDVDLDDEVARRLAPRFLPYTPATTGRAGSERSHWWYIAPGTATRQFRMPATSGTRAMIVEIRSTGAQTLVGPSIHPSGEVYDALTGEPAVVDPAALAASVESLVRAVLAEKGVADEPVQAAVYQQTATSSNWQDEHAVLARAEAYLDRMEPAVSGQGGHGRLYAAATAMVHGFGLSESEAMHLLATRYNPRCTPSWSERELRHKVEDAGRKSHDRPYGWLRDQQADMGHVGVSVDLQALLEGPVGPAERHRDGPPWLSLIELMERYPTLDPPVVEGLLRRGETMNIVAAPKVGKSWLAADLAISVAMGRPFLGIFGTTRGKVLVVDNELRPGLIAKRVPTVAQARGVDLRELSERYFVLSLRGNLRDLYATTAQLGEWIERDEFDLIIFDAFYRFMPKGGDENDNGLVASLYNELDRMAAKIGAAIVLVHHTSKGVQSGKGVTDVGAGAGSQSRAADAHIVVRAHDEPGCFVLEAAVRSWPPRDPIVVRKDHPVFVPEPDLDPTELAGMRAGRGGAAPRREAARPAREITPEEFSDRFLTGLPAARADIEDRAVQAGVSARRARACLDILLGRGEISVKRSGFGGPMMLHSGPGDQTPASE